jgi:ABC-type branched-subunit amino acid transport system ATPase component
MLEIRSLHAGYGKIEVLYGISIQVQPGEIVCVIGPNGAGKTTTLRSVFGLTNIMNGYIIFAGEEITGIKPHSAIGKGIVYVPQEKNIFPSLTVLENLELGAYNADSHQLQESLERIYQRFPVLKERRDQWAGTLSGGERQMLALGRGLMSSPKLMLLDEPSLGLAPKIIESLFTHIQEIHNAGTTILLVEQNARRALAIADRAYVLDLGQVRFEGSGEELLTDKQVQKAYLGG